MEINNLYYGILLYIIIVASLVFLKPDFVYDHKKSKYKEYGTTGNKTIFTLPVTAVLLAILIAIIVVVTTKKDPVLNQQHQLNQQYQHQQQPNIQYIPMYYQPLHQIQYVQQPQLQQQLQQQIQNPVIIADVAKTIV